MELCVEYKPTQHKVGKEVKEKKEAGKNTITCDDEVREAYNLITLSVLSFLS